MQILRHGGGDELAGAVVMAGLECPAVSGKETRGRGWIRRTIMLHGECPVSARALRRDISFLRDFAATSAADTALSTRPRQKKER